jgi:hypothetical protein
LHKRSPGKDPARLPSLLEKGHHDKLRGKLMLKSSYDSILLREFYQLFKRNVVINFQRVIISNVALLDAWLECPISEVEKIFDTLNGLVQLELLQVTYCSVVF